MDECFPQQSPLTINQPIIPTRPRGKRVSGALPQLGTKQRRKSPLYDPTSSASQRNSCPDLSSFTAISIARSDTLFYIVASLRGLDIMSDCVVS